MLNSIPAIDEALAYPPKRAAEITGRSVARIFQLIREGKLTAKKDGSATLIERDELARWIRSLPLREVRQSARV